MKGTMVGYRLGGLVPYWQVQMHVVRNSAGTDSGRADFGGYTKHSTNGISLMFLPHAEHAMHHIMKLNACS